MWVNKVIVEVSTVSAGARELCDIDADVVLTACQQWPHRHSPACCLRQVWRHRQSRWLRHLPDTARRIWSVLLFVTSAEGRLCFWVCLSSAAVKVYLKSYESFLMKFFWRGGPTGTWPEVQVIRFWWRSGSQSRSKNF